MKDSYIESIRNFPVEGYPCKTCPELESCGQSSEYCEKRIQCSGCGRPVANVMDEGIHNTGDCHCKSSEALCWHPWWKTENHRAPG